MRCSIIEMGHGAWHPCKLDSNFFYLLIDQSRKQLPFWDVVGHFHRRESSTIRSTRFWRRFEPTSASSALTEIGVGRFEMSTFFCPTLSNYFCSKESDRRGRRFVEHLSRDGKFLRTGRAELNFRSFCPKSRRPLSKCSTRVWNFVRQFPLRSFRTSEASVLTGRCPSFCRRKSCPK